MCVSAGITLVEYFRDMAYNVAMMTLSLRVCVSAGITLAEYFRDMGYNVATVTLSLCVCVCRYNTGGVLP